MKHTIIITFLVCLCCKSFSQNVGIGTSSPVFKLDIQGNGGLNLLRIKDTINNVDVRISTFNAPSIGTFEAHSFSLVTNNQKRLFIHSNGNIGLGTITANAPLQMANVSGNRKIVLWEEANNDHNFYGFGINNELLRYQSGFDHAFYSMESATSSKEILRLRANGNVGIGIALPNAPLQFATSVANRKIVLWAAENNDHQYYGFGVNNNVLRYQSVVDHVFYSAATATTSKEILRLQANGNVGIGNTAPNAPLQFATTVGNRKIVLWAAENNDHQYFGFGVNDNVLRYQSVADHVFYSAATGTTSNELLRIQANGNVGVGTVTPNSKLDVNGSINVTGNATVTGDITMGYMTYSTEYQSNAHSRYSLAIDCPQGTKIISGGGGHRDFNAAAEDIAINYSGLNPNNPIRN